MGTEGRKHENLSFKTAWTIKGGYWREKVSDLFGQTAHFPPVGSGRKSSRKSGPPYRFLSRGVLSEENFKIFRSKPAKPSSGYWREKIFGNRQFCLSAEATSWGTEIFFKNLWSKRPLITGGKWEEIFSPKNGPLGRFSSSGYWKASHQAIHPMGLTAQVFLVNGDGRWRSFQKLFYRA